MALGSETTIRLLTPSDAEAFRALRLRGLLECPQAFGSCHAEEVDRPLEATVERLSPGMRGAERAAFGAFAGDALVGIVACVRESRVKTRHRAAIYGMYVAPEFRRAGMARKLLDRVIAEARTWQGVDWITLSVVERIPGARAMYIAAGFVPYGFEIDALREGDARDSMEHLALDLSV